MRTVDMVTVGLWTAQLIQLILNGIFCAHVLTPRFSGNRTLALATLFQLPYILISHFFISNGVVNWICAASYLLMTFRIFYTDSWLRIVAAVCGIYLLIFPTTFIAASLMRLFGIMPYDVLEGRLEMMGNFLFSFVYFAVIYIFIFFKERRHSWSSRSIMAAAIFSVVQLFLVQAIVYLTLFGLPVMADTALPNAALIAGTALCMAADLLLFRMLTERSQKEELALQLNLMEKQSRLELTYYHSVNQKLQEVRKLRHDFNNQLQTAYGVLAQGDSEEAKTLLRQLEERIAASSPVCYCANAIVNAILWEKGQEAEEKGIRFEADVRLPEQIHMEKVDLCSCFSNLLDNGIQAAARQKGERMVTVRAYERGGCCVIQVENTAGPREVAEARAAKDGHGYGLPILQTIARRYGGQFAAEQIPGGFRTALTLPLGNQEGGERNEAADL